MDSIGRRQFIEATLGAAALSALAPRKNVAASDRVRIGVMGVGGRGTLLAGWFAAMPDVEVVYLCDVNQRRFDQALDAVETAQGSSPELIGNFRAMLDDKTIDAVVNATPDHWHAPGTVMACQAGKDVYVEKPLSHDIREGRKMIEAARKYKRVVQVGTQTRSSEYVKLGAEYIESGNLGRVSFVRVVNMMQKPDRTKGPEQEPPRGYDWNMWCGPAPLVPYSPGMWWMDRWDYNTGTIANESVHQLDLARMLTGIDAPDNVFCAGGVHGFDDGREIPDTQIATYRFGKLTLSFEAAIWTPYIKKIPHTIRDSDSLPDWPFCSTRVEVYGDQGMMYFGRQGGGWQAFDKDGKVVRTQYGRQGDPEHLRNFIDCIRTRETPNADVAEGHKSTMFCHLANVSCRLGNRQLEYDPSTGKFVNDPEADRLIGRTYREPWTVPDEV